MPKDKLNSFETDGGGTDASVKKCGKEMPILEVGFESDTLSGNDEPSSNLGICVRNGRTGGELEVPTSNERANEYTLIWNPDVGLVALLGHKLARCQWVLFTLSDQFARIELVDRILVSDVEMTEERRPAMAIAKQIIVGGRTKNVYPVIQVMAYVYDIEPYNDYYCLGEDKLLGQVLIAHDSFVKKCSWQEQLNVQLSVVFKENCVANFHWVAIAVNERRQDGEVCFRKLYGLPRFIDDLASLCYYDGSTVFGDRPKERNPLNMMFRQGNVWSDEEDEVREALIEEYTYGLKYGFAEDYTQDINAGEFEFTCLVVYAHEKAALVYHPDKGMGVVRSCDFGSQQSFKKVCQLGNWITGLFVKPYLAHQFKLSYNYLPTKNHRIHVDTAPNGEATRIRHFRGYYQWNPPTKLVMVQVECHFTKENVKRTRQAFMSAAEGGYFVKTDWGWVYVDHRFYELGNFENKRLRLWVCCPACPVSCPKYLALMTSFNIGTPSPVNCYWHFVGALHDDPYGLNWVPDVENELEDVECNDKYIYTRISNGLAFRRCTINHVRHGPLFDQPKSQPFKFRGQKIKYFSKRMWEDNRRFQ